MTSLTPAEFGALHRKFVETRVAKKAAEVGETSATDALNFRIVNDKPFDRDLMLALPFLREVMAQVAPKELPLGAAYALIEKNATAAALHGASTALGKITNASGRFLPVAYRAAFQQVTGESLDRTPGVSVPGIQLGGTPEAPTARINFAEVTAGLTADNAVLASSPDFELVAKRLDRPERLDIAPYILVVGGPALSPRIVQVGTEIVDVSKNVALTLTADANNTYSYWFLPSAKTEAVRNAWLAQRSGASFDFSSAIAAGKLVAKDLPAARKTFGIGDAFDAMRAWTDDGIAKLVKKGALTFADDPATQSTAARLTLDGNEYVFIVQKRKLQGLWVTRPGQEPVWREAPLGRR